MKRLLLIPCFIFASSTWAAQIETFQICKLSYNDYAYARGFHARLHDGSELYSSYSKAGAIIACYRFLPGGRCHQVSDRKAVLLAHRFKCCALEKDWGIITLKVPYWSRLKEADRVLDTNF